MIGAASAVAATGFYTARSEAWLAPEADDAVFLGVNRWWILIHRVKKLRQLLPTLVL